MYGSQQMHIIEDRRKDAAQRIGQVRRILQSDDKARIEICVIGGPRIVGDWAETSNAEARIMSTYHGETTTDTVALEDIVSVAVRQGARAAEVVPPRMFELEMDQFIVDEVIRRIDSAAIAHTQNLPGLLKNLNDENDRKAKAEPGDIYYHDRDEQIRKMQTLILAFAAPMLRPVGRAAPVPYVETIVVTLMNSGVFGNAKVDNVFKGEFTADDRAGVLQAAFARHPEALAPLKAKASAGGSKPVIDDLPQDLGRVLVGTYLLEILRQEVRIGSRPYMHREELRQKVASEFASTISVDASDLTSPD